MKEQIKREYYSKIRKITGTELNAKNKITAINSLALPVATYSFGVIDWRREEIRAMDRKSKKLLTIGGMLHPKTDVDGTMVEGCWN